VKGHVKDWLVKGMWNEGMKRKSGDISKEVESGERGMEVMDRDVDFWRRGMVGHWCCSRAMSR
jgi:hypothetical protein